MSVIINLSSCLLLILAAHVGFMSCAILQGDVTIGNNCKIHPTAQILARRGSIRIGNGNEIGARVVIDNNASGLLTMGNNNVFMEGSYLSAFWGSITLGNGNVFGQRAGIENNNYSASSRVGNNNVFGSNSLVGSNVEVTNNCVIGAGCRLTPSNEQRLVPNTVISNC